MILFGYRSNRRDIVEDRMCKCPRCGGGPMAHNIFRNYFHIWYIPFFPLNKKMISKCMSCGAEVNQNELPPGTKEQAFMNSAKRTPVCMFSGVMLFFLAGGIAFATSSFRKDKNTATEFTQKETDDQKVGEYDKVKDDYGPADPDEKAMEDYDGGRSGYDSPSSR